MTLPYERANAVKRTEQFLIDLGDSKKTPRVPKEIRQQARSLLKHYPTKFDMEIISKREDKRDPLETYQVFGLDIFRNEIK
jgi:hypothetical protein